MKKALWVLSALALVGIGFAGCGGEEECGDGYICDNEEFCDGQCGAGENCFGKDEADDRPICSKCEYDCAIMFPSTFKNCNETEGLCMNDASCPAGMTAQSNGDGTGLCVGGEQKTCTTNDECGEGLVCSGGACVAEGSVETKFKYVRIDDLSDKCKMNGDKCEAKDPGADIDAIVLVKRTDGSSIYAESVRGYMRSDGIKAKDGTDSQVASDPAQALGKPDSFSDYANSKIGGDCIYWKDKDAANLEHPYVSLGGLGGYLEVEMGGDIEKGDTLDILEVGGCNLTNTSDGGKQVAVGEKIKVSISMSGDAETWNPVGELTSDKDTNKGLLSFALTDDTYFK
jgi:hypothetical protein